MREDNLSANLRSSAPTYSRRGRAFGAGLAALSAALFGLLGFLASMGRAHGFTTQSLLTCRFGFAALILGLLARARGLRLALPLPVACELAIIGIVGNGLTALALFLAYERISTSLTTSLHFFYPVTIAAAASLLGRERFSARKAAALLLAISGTAVILAPRGENIDAVGVALALTSAFTYTVYVVGIGSRRLASLDRIVLVFWICLFAATAHLVNTLVTGRFEVHPDAIGIIAVVSMALFSTVLSIVAFTEGVRRIGPTAAAILSTLEPLTTALIGVFVLGEQLSTSSVIGATLILVSAIVVVLPL